MRCLVTGAAGFVGSHLVERLLLDGHDVCGIDSFIPSYPRGFKEHNLAGSFKWRNFTFIEGNLLTLDLPIMLEGIDWVFHQAAQAGVRTSWGQDFALYADNNILATQRLLDAVQQAGTAQRFIYASSSSIYGDVTTLPISESSIPRPVSPYGVTKLAGEHLCDLYHRNFGVPTVALRYFTVYGARQRPDMAFHRFCKAILSGQPIHVYGDGQQTRDFTCVSDVVEANVRAATSAAAIGQVMNIAGGSRVSLHDVIQLLLEITGSHIPVIFESQQSGDVLHTYADTRQAYDLIGYVPQVALAEGLQQEFAALAAFYKDVQMK